MKDHNERIAILLKKVGISPAILGYKYTNEAINMVLKDRGVLDGITKRLYPDIAKKYNTTPVRVERMIRYAVERSFERMPTPMRDAIFGNTISPYTGKPTNSEFIATLAEIVTTEPNYSIWRI